MVIQGNGFFQVRAYGHLAYTGQGAFISKHGQMVTSNGELLDPQITIPQTAQAITIGSDGTVSYSQPARRHPSRRARYNWRISESRRTQ